MTAPTHGSTVWELDQRRHAGLIAAALTRINPLLDELQATWGSLGIPTTQIIREYARIAQGLVPEPVQWSAHVDALPAARPNAREVLESGFEAFALAQRGIRQVNPSVYVQVLEAVEELVEALQNWSTAPGGVGVELERPGHQPGHWVDAEMKAQEQQTDLVLSAREPELPRVVKEILAESNEIGRSYVAALRKIRDVEVLDEGGEASGVRPRVANMLDALKTLSPADWAAVERCGHKLDRQAVMKAGREATKIVGIHQAHELLEGVNVLGLKEREPAWEIASWALLGAAAWDGLGEDAKRALTQCLVFQDAIKQVVDNWG